MGALWGEEEIPVDLAWVSRWSAFSGTLPATVPLHCEMWLGSSPGMDVFLADILLQPPGPLSRRQGQCGLIKTVFLLDTALGFLSES